MILPQEDLATTTKEVGAESATALGMATVVKGDDAIGNCSCKAALHRRCSLAIAIRISFGSRGNSKTTTS